MATNSLYLANSLAVRCTPELVGDSTVHVRQFDYPTRNAWWALKREIKGEGPEQLPYSIAITALRALTDGYVHLDPGFQYLVSRKPIQDKLLLRLFTYVTAYAKGMDTDQAVLAESPLVAQLISQTQEHTFLVADHLNSRNGAQPNSPNWVYNSITWDIARSIASVPFVHYELMPLKEDLSEEDKKENPDKKARTIGWQASSTKHEVTYLPVSNGDLVAWDAPIGRAFNQRPDQVKASARSEAEYAMSRISLGMKTFPNIKDPVLLLDAHMMRVYSNIVYAKTALVRPPGEGLPLLRIALDGRGGARSVNRFALEILARLNMDDTVLREIETRAALERESVATARANEHKPRFITPAPGTVRPIMPKNYGFSVGTGAGMHHLRLLAEHVDTVFGPTAQWLTMPQARMQFSRRPTDNLPTKERKRREEVGESLNTIGFTDPADIRKAVDAAEYKSLRLVCLWYRHEARTRMIHGLNTAFPSSEPLIDPKEGKEVTLAQGVSVVFHNAEPFLAHGPNEGRREMMTTFLDDLTQDPSVLVAAWCETEVPRLEKGTGEKADTFRQRRDSIDAKHQTKRILSELGVTTQYLKGFEEGKFGKPAGVIKPKKKGDYPAYMAILDIYRSLGILDHRIEEALTPGKSEPELPRLTFCGIHVRKQTRNKDVKGEPRRIVLATALVPSAEPGEVWTMLGWTSINKEWLPYREAQQIFHASDYPPHRSSGESDKQRWTEAARDVEEALKDLAEELDGDRYVLMVDGHACRRMWPGLQNQNQGSKPDPKDGRVWLPGHGAGTPVHKRPAGIVRLNIKSDEVPQPTSVTRFNKDGEEVEERWMSTKLHQVETDFADPFWVLFNVPRNYDGSGGGRLGSTRTRWQADPGKGGEQEESREKNELKAPWYTMTATEIYPVAVDEDISSAALAHATARLCHQTISWCDRSRYPAPLHAAKQMDLDHPQYRRFAPPEEQSSSEEEEEFED